LVVAAPKIATSLLVWALLLVHTSTYKTPGNVRVSTFGSDGTLETYDLADFEGKIVVLYYFTPW
ncbi:MAG: hypothetical protein L7V86_04575, partial [Verrucomicrobiales bacterium]|nr:hypothetical protein [Verrucomicrobiales bacterium]